VSYYNGFWDYVASNEPENKTQKSLKRWLDHSLLPCEDWHIGRRTKLQRESLAEWKARYKRDHPMPPGFAAQVDQHWKEHRSCYEEINVDKETFNRMVEELDSIRAVEIFGDKLWN